jgi:serine/threonine-protein kinase
MTARGRQRRRRVARRRQRVAQLLDAPKRDATIVLLEPEPPALDAARSDRYQIERPIGAGGYAEVLLGVVRGTDGFRRPVVVKRVRSELADRAKFVAMLIEEAHLASRLSHPNVVSVLDFGRDAEGRPYLVMEHIDGIHLGTLMETGPVPYPVAIFIVRELLTGLGYIHQPRGWGRGSVGGLVHRDVTPRNVLLSWAGEIKLADFGLAQVLEGTRTVASALVGTPGYMSPEQITGEPLDGRSDLFAAGILAWEGLTGTRLFTGTARESFAQILFRDAPPPSRFAPDVPADLEAVVMRLLARDRQARYPAAAAAIDDLARCAGHPRDGRGEFVRWMAHRFLAGAPGSPAVEASMAATATAPIDGSLSR